MMVLEFVHYQMQIPLNTIALIVIESREIKKLNFNFMNCSEVDEVISSMSFAFSGIITIITLTVWAIALFENRNETSLTCFTMTIFQRISCSAWGNDVMFVD